MAFSDEDLEQIEKDYGHHAWMKALLARLEAAEACIEEAKGMGLICCEDVCCKGTAYSRWRAVCGLK